MTNLLQGKKILIIGAGGLLGSKLSHEVVKNGGFAVCADISLDKATDVSKAINSQYDKEVSEPVLLDVSSEDSLSSVFNHCGIFHGLVNSSYPRGKNYGKKLEEVSYETFNENVSLHLGGYFSVMKEAGLYASATSQPLSIVSLSSIYGVIPPKFEIYSGTTMTMPVEYAAIKSSIIHLNKYFSKYFKSTGIRYNSVSPGGLRDKQPASFQKSYNENTLTKGMLDPEDIVGSVIFLLSDFSTYITGQNIIVDDGFSL